MKITADHWLDGAVRVNYPAGPAMDPRRFLVWHFTAGATAMSSIDFWKSGEAGGAECHLTIDRDGTIYQIRPFNQTCDHAGLSDWIDPNTGKRWTGLNSCSIGIEFANAGDSARADGTAFTRFPLPAGVKLAKHRLGGPMTNWEVFPEVQLAAGVAASQAIKTRYNLDDCIGHEDCAYRVKGGVRIYDRKNDPGPLFPMLRFREACGFTGLPRRG